MSGHGTHNRYTYGCRCEECRVAHNVYSREWAARNRASVRARRKRGVCIGCGGTVSSGNGVGRDPDTCRECYDAARSAQHGTNSMYTKGCRCTECRVAHAAYQREWYRRQKVAA